MAFPKAKNTKARKVPGYPYIKKWRERHTFSEREVFMEPLSPFPPRPTIEGRTPSSA